MLRLLTYTCVFVLALASCGDGAPCHTGSGRACTPPYNSGGVYGQGCPADDSCNYFFCPSADTPETAAGCLVAPSECTTNANCTTGLSCVYMAGCTAPKGKCWVQDSFCPKIPTAMTLCGCDGKTTTVTAKNSCYPDQAYQHFGPC